MKICEVLKPEHIIAELTATPKEKIIDELLNVFVGDDRIADIEVVRKAVKEREKIMSTGVGHGFAIPHGKTNGANNIIAAFAKTSTPVDFEALDGQPVSLIFLLVGKENMVAPHIKLLSRISRMMNNTEFREALLQAKTSEEIYSLFEAEEDKYQS